MLKSFEDIRVNISKKDVLRLLGRKNGNAPARTEKRLNQFIDQVRNLVKAKVVHSIQKITDKGKSTVTLEGGISFKSVKLAEALSKCDKATVFLVTIGSEIDVIINDLSNKNKLSDAYIYDAIGSVAVEAVVDDFQNKFDFALSDSLKSTTLRFSPGYCDWNIKEQKKIFELLDGKAAGFSLSPTFFMNPRKSVSGVFGIAPGTAEARPDQCSMCSRKSCIARR